MSTEIAIKPMNKTEAKAAVVKITEQVAAVGLLLLEFRDRNGWQALGYESFKDCCEKEFADVYGSRSQIYRLITQAQVTSNVSRIRDTATPVPIGAAENLGTLPAEEQIEVVEEVQKKHDGALPADAVKKAVQQRKKTQTTRPAAPTKASDKTSAALDRIEAICGKGVRKAIEQRTLRIPGPDLIRWAAESDAQMAKLEPLIVERRYKVAAAIRFLKRMPDEKTTVGDLHLLSVTNGGVACVQIGAFTVLCYNHRKAGDAHAKVKKALGID